MTIKNLGPLIGLAVGGFLALAPHAMAQEAVALGEFNAWEAWQGNDTSGMTCYISGVPQSSLPAGANRDPIHFIIIHRKAMGIKNEVQTIIGYPFSTTKANASATIDGKSYPMVTEGSAAWLASTADEGGFVTAFKAGSKLVVKGTSQRGTTTTDTYSLSGATAAMNAIDAACK
ncbi:invasion associated locus B family protein [Devosia rhodophyticola]|uniref:Invasion associated locus B family protein n=1 Tax=Devosia rhodophyticola TaxID=3026423 RepID=A0ABY7YTW5_9HYPH|nr:invasion associated locus B family protein [Devosia rhodophyticola]WDR04404.1 invasion associated locus B family protein [Devosia rhodophyticola]